MDSKLMHEALQKRKVNGLDITILLGAPGEKIGVAGAPGQDADEEAKELDMAPPATELGEAQDADDEALGKLGHQGNMTPGAELINERDPAQEAEFVRRELGKAQFGKSSLTQRGMMQKKA